MYIVPKPQDLMEQMQNAPDESKTAIAASGSPDVLQEAKNVLENARYSVLSAKNGFQVIRYLDQERPDLIVLDTVMPMMTGIETLQKIKDALDTSTIPVILLTGEADYDELLKGYNYGAAYCIPKPLTKTQLLNGIDLFCSDA